MDRFPADDEDLDPIAQVQTWATAAEDSSSTVQLPITLSLSPAQRIMAFIIMGLSLAGAWGTLHYVHAGLWDAAVGLALCGVLLVFGIGLSVSSVIIDQNEYTEIGAWSIESVPLTSVVEVRHHEDMVALATTGGDVKVIGPLGDSGRHTLSHGLPPGATAAGVAASVDRARRTAADRPPPATRRRLPPGYMWAAVAVGVLLVRVLTLFVL